MLKEVQDIIKRIELFLANKDNFETVVEEGGLAISVFPRNAENTLYHGYELYLIEKVVQKLGSTLEFKFVKDDEGVERFIVTTDANFNLESAINTINKSLRNSVMETDELSTVFICEKLTKESHGDYSILTGRMNGSWGRYDITKAEILYAVTHDLNISMDENGIFVYKDLIAMNNQLFDESEQTE